MDSVEVDKAELLRRMERSFRAFDALLTCAKNIAEIPGVTEIWSVKDVIAHLIAHEQRTIAELRYAKRGEHLPIKHEENDSFNDGAVYDLRIMPFAMVRDNWHRSYERVVAMIESLDEADFDGQSEVVKLLEDSIDGAVANNTYEHYDFHGAQIEVWLAKQVSG